ncbi:ATP-dependent Clp protease ATP-binding subunit clpX-like, mitochondrial [Melanaphis sacchari]|uniref:ATP-dependent Clp protease ATP-binding subunit clpX-like, mitochondrial n=1 Tax=Melanaphis sacchari TaxID=742174 RepID=UPI000DC15622|nr:ATP-dependent Clp protease ATP-binding subunit clpX-like, mitochondrial [Melanaphis sacchari]
MATRLKYFCMKIFTRSKLDNSYLNLSRNFSVLSNNHIIKDIVHQNNFQTLLSYWNVENFGTRQKGNNAGQTRILCSKCQNVNLAFFLISNRFLICQRCDYIFKVISAEKNKFKPPPPTPKEIVVNLNKYVIGQDLAKKVLAVAAYNHCKRIIHITAPQKNDLIEQLFDNLPNSIERFVNERLSRILQTNSIKNSQEEIKVASKFEKTLLEKSNIILLGPTGCGKTLLAQTIAKQLDVSFAICDCSNLTQTGYVGDDINSIIRKLLQAANNNVDKAQTGIVFLDEIDKISALPNIYRLRDVGGKGVQQEMLKMLEGTVINVPGKNTRKFRNEAVQIDTTNILFVASGAFIGLDRLISQRTDQISIGFEAKIFKSGVSRRDATKADFVDTTASYTDNEKENVKRDELLKKIEPRDLIQFGMIPEFLGRFPILVPLQSLNINLLTRILTEPENSVVNQFKLQFSLDKVELTFTDEALRSIASQALEKKTGARGLRAILECILLDSMFEIPRSNIVSVLLIEPSTQWPLISEADPQY